MKQILLFVLVLLMAGPAAEAGRKKKKAGQIENSVYTDSRFGFRLAVHDNWKARVQDEKDPYRLMLTQKNYGVPPDYQQVPDYTKVPRLAIFADSSEMGAFPFLDSLLSESFESEQKKIAMKELEILYEADLVPMGRKRADIAGGEGVVWQGKSKYVKEIQETAGSVAGKRVYGAYGGAIIVAKGTNVVLVFHVMCEWDFFQSVMDEVMEMVGSLQWSAGEDDKS